ncbi:class I SAM-dependent methyltransferase [Ferrimonas lipolytica]|uniref:Class I SAM-dependent methyltransferase n=1 Tax=Ferrimonas lipolytica TaxID=2724191 RepID=A0A6H1UKU1_9GAMM|nr:class I SAM-dependent methyltransferase [Ferrimonas lipolytica]
MLSVAATAVLALPLFTAPVTASSLSELAVAEHRSDNNINRNEFRHPVATLELFGLHPDMTVIELWPGGGWYSEILAPYLRANGKFIAASFDTSGKPDSYYVKNGLRYQQKLAANPEIYGKTEVIAFQPPAKLSLGVDNSADLVLTFRNLHNWATRGHLPAVFEAAFSVLSPGGVFGVVEHRGYPGIDPKSGYMDEAEIIALAENSGFRLALKSEINANPKDTKDYPKGVWTLPPSLRMKQTDQAKYLAIGESDRMTLKFFKPEI